MEEEINIREFLQYLGKYVILIVIVILLSVLGTAICYCFVKKERKNKFLRQCK